MVDRDTDCGQNPSGFIKYSHFKPSEHNAVIDVLWPEFINTWSKLK